MKTIFDWLTMPMFRERTGMFLGRRDPEALDIWIDGYQRACEDAGEHERLRIPGCVVAGGFAVCEIRPLAGCTARVSKRSSSAQAGENDRSGAGTGNNSLCCIVRLFETFLLPDSAVSGSGDI